METDLLRDRLYDTVNICERTNKPKFLGFLSCEQVVFARNILSKLQSSYEFYGGYEDAQRVMLGCFPDWAENVEFPITAVTAEFRKADVLTHRDVLGSLMALGLKRETVGDILIEEGRAIVFLCSENADYVISQISKIGKVGVTLEKGFVYPLPKAGEMIEQSVTVASERLDCVVSALIGVSRNKALEKIEQSLVTVNSIVTEKATARVTDGDIISVRSKGKFIIVSIQDRTKKDRLILKYKKYV